MRTLDSREVLRTYLVVIRSMNLVYWPFMACCMQINEWYTFFINFNSERDSLDRDVVELKKSNTLLDAALKTKSDSLIDLQKEVYISRVIRDKGVIRESPDFRSPEVGISAWGLGQSGHGLVLTLVLMLTPFSLVKIRHKHKHKKNKLVRFSCVYVYTYVDQVFTRLHMCLCLCLCASENHA